MKRTSKQPVGLPARMGSRTLEVKPVGAWVKPEVLNNNCTEDAVVIYLFSLILLLSPITTSSNLSEES